MVERYEKIFFVQAENDRRRRVDGKGAAGGFRACPNSPTAIDKELERMEEQMVPQKSQAGVVHPSSRTTKEPRQRSPVTYLPSSRERGRGKLRHRNCNQPTQPNSSKARQKHGDQPPASGIEGLSNNSRLAVNNRSKN